jgi:hypothetical protein
MISDIKADSSSNVQRVHTKGEQPPPSSVGKAIASAIQNCQSHFILNRMLQYIKVSGEVKD